VYDTAVRSEVLLNLEHAVLIVVGLMFWWPVLCDTPRSLATLGRIGYVLAAFVFSAFLGLALTFSPPLYSYYEARPRLWGITAEQDQNLGGILMSTEQAIVIFSAVVWLLVRLLREEEAAEERLAAEQRAAGLRQH
jgi:cytochrome c oxidase assembly factor CtaG